MVNRCNCKLKIAFWMSAIRAPQSLIYGVLKDIFEFIRAQSNHPIHRPVNDTSRIACNFDFFDIAVRAYGLQGK